MQFVSLAFSPEQGFHEEEFSENAAHGPHINVGGVLFDAQQKFRGSVPQCDHDGGVGLQGRPILTG